MSLNVLCADIVDGLPADYDLCEDALIFQDRLQTSRDVSFVTPVTISLKPGSYIICTGTPSVEIPWFSINFCNSTIVDHTAKDVAVHFNVRVPQRYVVRNTKKAQVWGTEETNSTCPFPFQQNVAFTVEVLIGEEETLWCVNGMHYCTYQHRTPTPFSTSSIQIIGIRNAEVAIGKTEKFPVKISQIPEITYRVGDEISEGVQDELEYTRNMQLTLPDGIAVNQQIVIIGRLRKLLQSFVLELAVAGGEAWWPKVHVGFHAQFEALVEDGTNEILLNSWTGAWGAKRKQTITRLVPGAKVKVQILRTPRSWQLYASELLVGALDYRLPPDDIRVLRVRGDLIPQSIYLMDAEPV